MKKWFWENYPIVCVVFALIGTFFIYSIIYSILQDSSLGGSSYPIPFLTQCVLRSANVEEICAVKTSLVRNVSEADKKEIYRRYGVSYPQPKGKYEVDHYCPLGIGGSNDLKNLGLEPAPEFHQKDRVEAHLRRELCSGRVTQREAVLMIKNWRKTYDKIKNNLGDFETCEEGCP